MVNAFVFTFYSHFNLNINVNIDVKLYIDNYEKFKMYNNIYALRLKYKHIMHAIHSQRVKVSFVHRRTSGYPSHRTWIESIDGQIPFEIAGFHDSMGCPTVF